MQATQLISPILEYDSPSDSYKVIGEFDWLPNDPTSTLNRMNRINRRAICGNFVRGLLGKPAHSQVPPKIALVLDSEPSRGAIAVRFFCIPSGWGWESDHPNLAEICETDETVFLPTNNWLDKEGIQHDQVFWISVKEEE